MNHDFYIYSAYGAAGLVSLCLVLWVVLDGRARQREMKALEAAGLRRRSAAKEKS
ncbi:heme exporter protein CcmD [Allorhizobium undicola]|uniref:heme exporter protein CcmD n=1 Tax=Allorhizobium undicola TaxID=78527 RepID=UPI0004875A6D|nr:heme exporter protein CcmD [Allorhizobium undicola]